MSNIGNAIARLVDQRIGQILKDVLDPAPERLCASCVGEGYILGTGDAVDPMCESCGGSGLRERSGGDDA